MLEASGDSGGDVGACGTDMCIEWHVLLRWDKMSERVLSSIESIAMI